MKFAVIVGSYVQHDAQGRTYQLLRQYSRPSTQIVVVFNGVASQSVPAGVSVVTMPHRLGQEQGLWPWAFRWAQENAIDWLAMVHDDMWILESGWEGDIERAARRYRIGVAGWEGHAFHVVDTSPDLNHFNDDRRLGIIEQGDSSRGAGLCVLCDGCGVVFNMGLFAQRGFFTDLDVECGYGCSDACMWCLSQEHAVWGLHRRYMHHRAFGYSRAVSNIPLDGYVETWKRYKALNILPCWRYDEDHLHLGHWRWDKGYYAAEGGRLVNMRTRTPDSIPGNDES